MFVRVQELADDGAPVVGRDWRYRTEIPGHLAENGYVCAAIAWMYRLGEKGEEEVKPFLEEEWIAMREGFSNEAGEEVYQVYPAVSLSHFPVFKMTRDLSALYKIHDDMDAEVPIGTVRIVSL